MGVLVKFGIVDKNKTVFQMREFKPSLGFDRTRRVLVIVGDNSWFVSITAVTWTAVGTIVATATTGRQREDRSQKEE